MNNFLEKRDVRESKMSVQMGIIQSVREMFQVVYPWEFKRFVYV